MPDSGIPALSGLLLVLSLLPGCADGDKDTGQIDLSCADPVLWYHDGDGDGHGTDTDTLAACSAPEGFVASQDDCNDVDATIFPGAGEICNGYDDDCDGLLDDADSEITGQTPWYPDQDGDGHGNAALTYATCTVPVNSATTGDDCDDNDAEVSPEGVESCNGYDDDCDTLIDDADDSVSGTTAWYPDADGDTFGASNVTARSCAAPKGMVESSTDCDDTTAAVNPDATEVCDGYDDNCDGVTDDEDDLVEGTTAWHADSDLDGFGGAAAIEVSCIAPEGAVADGTDCDDAAVAVNPAAIEVCNSIDDDCDLLTDDADIVDTSVGGITSYADHDHDAWGDPATETTTCVMAAGRTEVGGDCDDLVDTIHPERREVCNEIDDDCNLLVDDEDPAVDASDGVTSFLDLDVDGYGDPATVLQTCLLPEGRMTIGEDCDDTSDLTFPGAPDTCNDGVDEDCSGADLACGLADAAAVISGEASADYAAWDVADGGDFTGDGQADVLVGSLSWFYSGRRPGAAYVVAGPVSGAVSLADAVLRVGGESNGDYAGSALVGARDLDGDGLDDLLLGVYGSSRGGGAGAAAWVSGGQTGQIGLLAADGLIAGASAGESFGYAVELPGDLDGNGVEDIAIGASTNNDVGASAGAVYLWHSAPTGSVDASTADVRLTGVTAADDAGFALTGPGDLNGDGLADLVVSAPQEGGGGLVYVLYGPVVDDDSLANADITWTGEEATGAAGEALAPAGDQNGDGLADLLVSDPDASGAALTVGAAYLLYGPAGLGGSLYGADWITRGTQGGGHLGSALLGGRDLDEDGQVDIVVGASGVNTTFSRQGAVYAFTGGGLGEVDAGDAVGVWVGPGVGDNAGSSLAWTGDLTGDTLDDFVIGASDDSGSGNGKAYVWAGPGL